MKDVFRSGDSSKKFKIAEGQWYRYAPSYVSPAYHLLEGFPFIQEPPSGDLQERVLRSEERFSRNAETDLVCRLLLEKKKIQRPARVRGYWRAPSRTPGRRTSVLAS